MAVETVSVARVRVCAQADDTGALMRVLERFHNLNVLPRRVIAEIGTAGTLHVQIDLTGLPESTLSLIAARLLQLPSVLEAYWCRP